MKRLFYIVITAVIALCACENSPSDLLSRGDLEDVLYDYHMMQGIIDQLPDSQKEKVAQDYINAVFEKHGITEAQFDSSITYYNRNTKGLAKIYSNLKERFSEATEEIQLQTGENDLAAMFTGGDTANIWAGSKMVMLIGNDMMRTESFSIICDTTCHPRDQFTLMFTPIFLKEKGEDNGRSMTAGLSIVYDNGKSVGITQQTSYPTQQRLTLKANDSTDIAKVNIFFYYKGNDDLREACIIEGISLVQMHEKKVEDLVPEESDDAEKSGEEKADSVKRIDTIIAPHPRALTPEEVRQENKSDKTIKIQSAPSIRRPNSYGPRRRPVRK